MITKLDKFLVSTGTRKLRRLGGHLYVSEGQGVPVVPV